MKYSCGSTISRMLIQVKLNKIYNISYITAGGIDFAIFILYNFFLTYYAFQTPKYFGIHIIVYSERAHAWCVCAKTAGGPRKARHVVKLACAERERWW